MNNHLKLAGGEILAALTCPNPQQHGANTTSCEPQCRSWATFTGGEEELGEEGGGGVAYQVLEVRDLSHHNGV